MYFCMSMLKNYAQIIVTIQGFSIGMNYNYEFKLATIHV